MKGRNKVKHWNFNKRWSFSAYVDDCRRRWWSKGAHPKKRGTRNGKHK